MANGSVGFDYKAVEAVERQVATTGEEVKALFKRLDDAIALNVGEGTNFKGISADAFKETWENAKAGFDNYSKKIINICDSAIAAGGIYEAAEASGKAMAQEASKM